jgi:1-acyl-sn-glycerol-3-phosphate acyltransferase
MTGLIRLVCRATLSILWITIIFFPLAITWQLRLERINSAVMMVSFYVGCLIWGIHVTTRGSLARARPLLVASNHFSYLDVFALGSRMPARFITKSEVASWPIIGFICRIGGCIFIDRRRQRTLHNMSELSYAVKQGAVISLFPEGTTNEGTVLKPFKSSFFSIAEDRDVAVQPVSVVYTRLSGKPIDAGTRPLVGWYGDAEFFPHMLRFLREPSVEITLVFHALVNSEALGSRKAIAGYCHDVIETSFADVP